MNKFYLLLIWIFLWACNAYPSDSNPNSELIYISTNFSDNKFNYRFKLKDIQSISKISNISVDCTCIGTKAEEEKGEIYLTITIIPGSNETVGKRSILVLVKGEVSPRNYTLVFEAKK